MKKSKKKKKVEGIFVDGKLTCPICKGTEISEIRDYRMSSNDNRKILFIRDCLGCGAEIRNYRNI